MSFSFFSKLKEAAAATVAEAVKTVGEVATSFSLDNLQVGDTRKFMWLLVAVNNSIGYGAPNQAKRACKRSALCLQDQYGDPSGRRAISEGMDITYLTPRLIGERAR